MDLTDLALFRDLARSGSIRATADAQGLSPTTVTRALDRLEHALGSALVERWPRGVRLTAAGEMLAARAPALSREVETLRQGISDLKGLRSGSARLHVNGAAIDSLLGPALAEFSAQYPGIRIEVSVTSSQGALDAAAAGMTDMSMTMFAPADARVVTRFRRPVRNEPVMAPDHPLAALPQISLADLMAHPLAMPDADFGVRRALDARLRAAGMDPAVPAFTTASLELQKELARRGSAVLILPGMAVQRELAAGDLVLRPFSPQARIEALLELSHSLNRHQSFAARRLLEFLEGFLHRDA